MLITKPRRRPDPSLSSAGPFMLEATPSSDFRFIRYITDANARVIGEVCYAKGAEQEENLANAALFMASHELREALDKAEALLVQLQETPQLARDIVRRSYFSLTLDQIRDALKRAQPKEIR